MNARIALLILLPSASSLADTWTEPAQISAPAGADEADVQHDLSLVWSPLHLTSGIVELTGEARLADSFGLGFTLGGGSTSGAAAFEGGLSPRWYPVGSFIHGLQLGAELLYLNVGSSKGSAHGASIGAFVGYKIATNVGFTFEAQAGASGVVASGTGGSARGVLPLVNLNVGWSFDI